MPTSKDIVNWGLGKIGASRVNNLSPPNSVLENLAATGYPHWKKSELAKRRWVFATVMTTISPIPGDAPDLGDGRLRKFNVPGDLLRPIRNNGTEWIRRGQFLYSSNDTLVIEYIANVPDAELTDPLFNDVLACRAAMELAEPATQSPGKRKDAFGFYKEALAEASRMNAFTLDNDNPSTNDDSDFEWLTGRLVPNA